MGDFTSGSEYDADLEARLYGEIYHSHETFPEENISNVRKTLLPIPVNQSYQSKNNYTNRGSGLAITLQSERDRRYPEPNRRSSSIHGNIPSTSYPRNSPAFQYPSLISRNHYHNNNFPGANNTNNAQNYHSPFYEDYNIHNVSFRNPRNFQQMIPPYRSRPQWNQAKNNHSEYNTPRKNFVPDRTKRFFPNSGNNNRVESPKTSGIQKLPDKSVKTVDENHKKVTDNHTEHVDDANNEKSNEVVDKLPIENTRVDVSEENIVVDDINNKSNDNKVDSVQHSPVTLSKYDVLEKQKTKIVDATRMNEIIQESDSEESIFEVPVPPKPKPPVINLRDSGESSSSEEEEEEEDSEDEDEDEDEDEESEKSSIIVINDSCSTDLSSVNEDLNIQGNQQVTTSTNVNVAEKQSPNYDIDQGNIILNCIELQKCASTLGDIRRIRESGGGSDDSMTDSEALNWGAIEDQIVEENRIISNEDSNQSQVSVNNFEKLNNRAKSHNLSESNINICSKTPPRKSAHVADSTKIVQKTKNLSESTSGKVNQDQSGTIINSNDKDNNAEKDKLPSCRSEKSKKRSIDNVINNVQTESSTSAKKSKNNVKSTAEMTFEEYVFQPMPKKLEKFYNTFRGEEFMKDVTYLQSKMPKNPNRWAILDIDLVGPKRFGKGTQCATCHNMGHKRNNCPEKKQMVVCYMCGEQGHYEPRCPYKMCLTCGTKYSTYRKTCEICRTLVCSNCKSQGHSHTNCPDLWRRFHQTTQSYTANIPSNPHELLRTSNKLACCNCARRGHESSMCMRYHWSQHFPTPRSITNYDKPPFYTSTNLVYHDTNLITNIETVNWIEEEIYPHTIPGVSYQFNKGCSSSTPTFFKNHIPSDILFDITINDISDKYVILLKTINETILYRLKLLLIQWLQRTREDRIVINNAKVLSVKQTELIEYLEKKWDKFNNYKFEDANDWLMHFNNLRERMAMIDSGKKKINKRKNRKKAIRNRLFNLKKRLVAVTYISSLAPNATRILELFRELVNDLKNLPIIYSYQTPGDLYLTTVWYNFELFTPHSSDYIISAAQALQNNKQKTKKVSKKNNKVTKKPIEDKSQDDDIQIIDLTKDADNRNKELSIVLTRIEDINVNDKIAKPKKQKAKNHNEKNYNKLTMRNKICSKYDNILRGNNRLSNQQLQEYANEILQYVEKNHYLNKFIKRALKLVERAQFSVIKKSHIVQFWHHIRTFTNQLRIPPNS